MKNYKRIGDVIRLVNERNKGMTINNLQGINIDKFFMPSVANVVGTDLLKAEAQSKNDLLTVFKELGYDIEE